MRQEEQKKAGKNSNYIGLSGRKKKAECIHVDHNHLDDPLPFELYTPTSKTCIIISLYHFKWSNWLWSTWVHPGFVSFLTTH